MRDTARDSTADRLGFISVVDLDAGLELAIRLCPPGKAITIHAASCPITPADPARCRCTPVTLVPGATA
jgi:hypothetical protein